MKTLWYFWVVGVPCLLWHAGGAFGFTMSPTREAGSDVSLASITGANGKLFTLLSFVVLAPVLAYATPLGRLR